MVAHTPVRALNSIKSGGVGRVTNNPVEFWILRPGMGDSSLGKCLLSLAERRLLISALQGTLHRCLLHHGRLKARLN